MEPKTGKRMVNKSAYVAAQGQRILVGLSGVTLLSLSLVLFVVTIMGSVLSCICLIAIFSGLVDVSFGIGVIIVTLVSAALTYSCWRSANRMVEHVDRIDPGIPFTRANTAALPAPDTLVRASEEPLQAQQAVLLRAAGEGQEQHEEQLVRALMGEEERS